MRICLSRYIGKHAILLTAAMTASIALVGCAAPAAGAASAASPSMTDALTAKPAQPAPSAGKGQAPGGAAAPAGTTQASTSLATVNGKPIAQADWLNLMKRAHGLSAFQQLLAVELARQAADAKGIRLTPAQLEEACRQEIAEIVGPETKDPAESDRILRTILVRRGIAMDEFRLSTYRNAYLRRIAEPLITPGITEAALKVEFDRMYGPKVLVRHIQLSDSGAVNKVVQALDNGEDFVAVAGQYSQNIDSAPDGGLLAPFSRLDPSVPAEIREVAFGLEVGKVSGAIRTDGWTQILKMEKRLPAEPVEFEKVAGEVRRSLTDHLVRQKMQELLGTMLESASIQVYDGELSKRFQSLREGK